MAKLLVINPAKRRGLRGNPRLLVINRKKPGLGLVVSLLVTGGIAVWGAIESLRKGSPGA